MLQEGGDSISGAPNVGSAQLEPSQKSSGERHLGHATKVGREKYEMRQGMVRCGSPKLTSEAGLMEETKHPAKRLRNVDAKTRMASLDFTL
jgi:hypothetical protein